MPQITHIVWDLDGTLINTTEIRARAQIDMAEAILPLLSHTETRSAEQIIAKMDRLVLHFGSTFYSKHIQLLCQDVTPDKSLQDRLFQVAGRAYRQTFWQIEAVTGAREVLQTLQAQNYKLGLASNGLYPVQMQKIKQAGLAKFFSPELTFVSSQFSRAVETPPNTVETESLSVEDLEASWLKERVEKPWPLMLKHALTQANAAPESVIFVGNRATDYMSANLLGVWSIAAKAYEIPEPPPILAIEKADFSIERLTDIVSVIDTIHAW